MHVDDLQCQSPLLDLVELGAVFEAVTDWKDDKTPMTMVASCAYNQGY